MPEEKLPIPQFAAKIKAKYPAYKDVNDTLLVEKILAKYPEYNEQVDWPPKKKENQDVLSKAGSGIGGQVGTSESPLIDEKKKMSDYLYGLKTEEQKNNAKPQGVLTTTLKKKQDKTGEKALSTINTIMLEDSDRWKDPVKSVIDEANAGGDLQTLNKAAELTRKSLSGSGFKAKQFLADSDLAKDENNLTTKMIKGRAEQYDKTTQPFRDLQFYRGNELTNNPDDDYNAKDKFYDAAIQSYANKNPSFAAQLKAADTGNGLMYQMDNATRGQILSHVLQDEDFADYIQNENPGLYNVAENVASNLLTDNKEFGVNVVSNEVSRGRQKLGMNGKFVTFDDKQFRESTNQLAEEMYKDDPVKMQIYNDEIRKNPDKYIDTPSFLEGFAHGAEGVYKGIGSSVSAPFSNVPETIKKEWEKQATHVSADPQGWAKFWNNTGHVLGLVSAIGGISNVAGAGGSGFYSSKVAPALAGTVPFAGDFYKEAVMKYPDSPVKAGVSTALNTILYGALSQRIFPAKQVQQAFSKIRPGVANIVENLTSGKITREVAKREATSLVKDGFKLIGGGVGKAAKISGELTGITMAGRGLDYLMMDEDQFAEYHPQGEGEDTFKALLMDNLGLGLLTKYSSMKKGNHIVEESLYEAATNPLRYKRVIDEMQITDPTISKESMISNLGFLTETKRALDELGVSEKNQKRYLFEALKGRVFKEQAEKLPEANLVRKNDTDRKGSEELREAILRGEDADKFVSEADKKKEEQLQKIRDDGAEAASQIESLKKGNELDNKEIDAKIKGLDKESETYSVQKEKLEKQREDKNKEHENKVSKLEKPSLIFQALDAIDKDLPEYLREGAKENIEGALKEAAEQLNSSEGEAQTARKFYGKTFSDVAKKLFPDAKVDSKSVIDQVREPDMGTEPLKDPSPEVREEVVPIQENKSNKTKVFRTHGTGMVYVGTAHRGTGVYYAIDKPFKPIGGENLRVEELEINIDPQKTLDLTTKKGEEEFADIQSEAKKRFDATPENSRDINTFNDFIRDVSLERGYTGAISYIEPGAPKAEREMIGREYVSYENKKQTNETSIPPTGKETEKEFKERYISKLKEVSPDQPERWYEFQAQENWNKKQQRENIIPPTEAKDKQSNISTEKESSVGEVLNEAGEGTTGSEPPKTAPGEAVEFTGADEGGITHAANEVRRQDRALPEYEKQAQSFEEWNNQAEKAIKDGYDVEGLMDKIEKGHDPTPVENAIRKIYIATLDAEIAKNPSDALLAKQKRFIEIGDLANSRAGRNLVSLKGEGSPLSTLSDFYVARMEAAGTNKLTPQQKAETKEAFDNVQKADANAEAAMTKYREEIARLKAENELLKQKKTTKPKSTEKRTHEDYVKERDSYRDELKKAKEKHEQWLKEQGIQQAGFGFTLTGDMVRAIGKIVKSHVEEGVEKLEEVVKKVFDDVKDIFPGITERDVQDVMAGEYNEKKPSRNDLAAKMRDLRDEAYYISKLEKLLFGAEPKGETQKRKRNKRITELQNKIKDFQRFDRESNAEPKNREEPTDPDLTKLNAIKAKNEKETERLKQRIAKGDFETKESKPFLEDPEMQKKFPKEYKSALDAIVKREEARHEFDIALLKDQMAKRRAIKKYVIDPTGDVIGTTKALVTGIDASGFGIQNLVAMVAHPRSAGKAVPGSVADMFSAKGQDRWLAGVHNSKNFPLAQKAGLDITEPQSLKASEREDMFTHNLLDRQIKYKGKKYVISKYVTKPFERLFTGLGNRMRWNLWMRGVEKLYEEGYTWESHPEEFKSLAKVLNTETGRGSLHPQVDKAFNLISAGIWSPRLMASRMNILGLGDLGNLIAGGKKGYYGGLTPKMRKYALRDFAKFVMFGATFLGLAGLTFADDVDLDPGSSTFGTFLVNGKRYNIWGGFTQYIRLIAKLIRGGETKSDGSFAKSDQLKTSLRFLWSKTTPAVGTAIGLSSKGSKDYMGQPITGGSALESLLVPLSIRGIAQGIKKEGLGSVIWTGIPSFLGTNVSYQSDFDKDDSSKPERPKSERPKREKMRAE